MTTPQLTRAEADQAVTTLGSAHDRIAAAMFGLDNHPGLSFLRGSGLTGATAQVAEHVEALMTQLWAQFSALGQQLEQARGTGDLVPLTRLLRGPAVALDGDGFPLDGAGPTPPATELTLAALAQGLETTTAELADLLTEVDTAVSTVASRLAALTDKLGAVSGSGVDVDGFAVALGELRDLALSDPVEVARGGASQVEGRLDRLAADLDAARTRLAELATLQRDLPQRLAGLRDAIARLAAAEVAAGQSYETVRVKIADPGLPAVPATAADLERRISTVDDLARADRWGRVADELAAVATAADDATAHAERLREAADGLLDRRTELRGRLSAYRAKAARHGYGEHPELSDRHREAHDLLYTSPCDLPAATRAVFRYQQALADLINRKETVT
jgi:uncharacterized coiled-coil protein SlyX